MSRNILASSINGIDWTMGINGYNNTNYTNYTNSVINTVVAGDDRWIAGGLFYVTSTLYVSLIYSYDGRIWRDCNDGDGSNVFLKPCNAICYNGSTFVAGGNLSPTNTATMVYSIDGINWTNCINTFKYACYTISYNGTLWVAGGDISGNSGITTKYSLNGISWTDINTNLFNSKCTSLTWNGTYWIAGGDISNNTIMVYSSCTYNHSSIMGLPVINWVPITYSGATAQCLSITSRRVLPFVGLPTQINTIVNYAVYGNTTPLNNHYTSWVDMTGTATDIANATPTALIVGHPYQAPLIKFPTKMLYYSNAPWTYYDPSFNWQTANASLKFSGTGANMLLPGVYSITFTFITDIYAPSGYGSPVPMTPMYIDIDGVHPLDNTYYIASGFLSTVNYIRYIKQLSAIAIVWNISAEISPETLLPINVNNFISLVSTTMNIIKL